MATSESLNPDVSVVPSASPASLPFIEREPNQEWHELAKRIRGYEQKLTEAINANSFAKVSPYLLPGSPLEKSQKALVENLASRAIKERFVSSEIYGYTKENDVYKVNVTENVEVTFPGKAPKIQEYKWIYTAEKRDGQTFFSQLEEWSSADFDRRAGAVKTDGYYAEDFMRQFPALLENAVNTLDLTDLKMVSPDRAVMARLKTLITELRTAGKEYSIRGNTVAENWNTYSCVLELTFTYTDNTGGRQSGSRKLFLQLDETRSGFSGQAIIRYLDDAARTPLLNEPEVTVFRFVEVAQGKPGVLLEVHGKAEEAGRPTFFQANQIHVYMTGENGEKGKLLQELNLAEPTRTPNGPSLGLVIEDMNFDGIPDVRIQSFTTPGPNIPYYYWLWDPGTAAFVKNTDLEAITSPRFQAADKTIFSRNRGSASSYTESTYRFINGTLSLLREVQYDYKTEKKIWHVTLRELANGKLQVTNEYEERN
ncbi:XAC2610-related protein [Paenibacillus ferrarius]|uniref:XAC2610-related protein n=1 Tax=Paenibacillus ferrarius TaxID=1469647 RepID=UPI003D2675A3